MTLGLLLDHTISLEVFFAGMLYINMFCEYTTVLKAKAAALKLRHSGFGCIESLIDDYHVFYACATNDAPETQYFSACRTQDDVVSRKSANSFPYPTLP